MITGSSTLAKPANEVGGLMLAAAGSMFGALTLLGSDRPLLLVAAPIAGAGLMFAARRPLVALIILVVTEVTNVSGVLAPHIAVPVFPASLLLGLLAVGFALRDPRNRGRLNAWTAACAGIFGIYLATQAVATIGSVDVSESLDSLSRATLDCVFVMTVLVLIQLTARPWAVAAAIVAPLALLSGLTLVNELVFNGAMPFGGFAAVAKHSGKVILGLATRRYGGPLPDSNFWGRYLVMAAPLAAALLTRALRSRRRGAATLWVLAVIAILAGLYLTQSRGTFVAAGTAIAVWFIASGRSVRRQGMAMLPVALLVIAAPGVGNRLVQALQDVTRAQVNHNVDPSVLGRVAAQQQAWLMFKERPFFGFGPGTFPGQVIEFGGRVPVAVEEPTDAPHNVYVEFLAGSGVIGLAGWLVLVLGFLTVVALAIVEQPRSPDRILSAAVCAAIVAWSAASVALHLTYFRTFGVVVALAAGLAPALPLSVGVARRVLRAVAVWVMAVVLGFSASWVYLTASSSAAVTATQRMTLIPEGQIDGWYAYALDIRSRVEFLPTIADIVHDPGSSVSVLADPVRGLLTFTAESETAGKARDEIQLAAAYAETALRSSIGYQQYSLHTVGSMQITPSQKRSNFATLVAGGLGVCTAIVAGLLLSRMWVRRRPDVASGQPSAHDAVTTRSASG
ncbi:O-antigen polymerase [Mycolicibacterium rhodesiae JS60]|nr:O-antigen polymerase [Mycolicibacterium rhodesiae JS60]